MPEWKIKNPERYSVAAEWWSGDGFYEMTVESKRTGTTLKMKVSEFTVESESERYVMTGLTVTADEKPEAFAWSKRRMLEAGK